MDADTKQGARRMLDLDAGFLVVGRRYRDCYGNVFTLHEYRRIGRRTSLLVSYDGASGMVRTPLRAVAPITPIGGSKVGKFLYELAAAPPPVDHYDWQDDWGELDFSGIRDAVMRHAKAAAILMMMIVAVLIVAYLTL